MTNLRFLLLEDSALDAELAIAALREGGITCDVVRVDTREAFREQLERGAWELILADYSLPGFDGGEALELARERCPEVPFLFVSGALGEELAIDLLRRGATDYVLKHRLDRLVPAVDRALREAAERRERRRLEEELRQRARQLAEADQRKDRFLAMLAHELRNPLAPILTALRVMREEGADPAAVQRAQDVVDRQVRHMARLLDDLLDISRITRSKILLRKQELDLLDTVRQTVQDHRPLLEEREITLRLELPSDPVWVRGDPTRLAQVLGNLLQNARKFTPTGGQVAVSLAKLPDRDAVSLTVADTGIGLDAEALPRLFEPFSQARCSEDLAHGGLGLGLALVKGLVELHEGSVEARSDGPGRGAEFRITLPVLAEPARQAAREGAPAGLVPAYPAQGRRVLVVDDNRDAADTLRDLLELSEHRVEVVYTGQDGLRAAREFLPEIVLCDLGLPGMSGFEVAAALRRDPSTASARLIAVSGYGQEEDRRRSREAGFDLHLIKPVNPADLERVLHSSTASGKPAL